MWQFLLKHFSQPTPFSVTFTVSEQGRYFTKLRNASVIDRLRYLFIKQSLDLYLFSRCFPPCLIPEFNPVGEGEIKM